MKNEKSALRSILIMIGVVTALAAAFIALYRTEKRVRQLCYRLEQRLGTKKNAAFRVDFEEV